MADYFLTMALVSLMVAVMIADICSAVGFQLASKKKKAIDYSEMIGPFHAECKIAFNIFCLNVNYFL